MIICGVYAIFNIINGDKYIGSSSNIHHRWNFHIRYMRQGTHEQRKLREAAKEFGSDNFTLILLEECNKEELKYKEQEWLDNCTPEYNTSKSAFSSIGVNHTEETKQHLSKVGKGIPREEARLANIGNQYRKGKKDSEKTRKLKSMAAKEMWKNNREAILIARAKGKARKVLGI